MVEKKKRALVEIKDRWREKTLNEPWLRKVSNVLGKQHNG